MADASSWDRSLCCRDSGICHDCYRSRKNLSFAGTHLAPGPEHPMKVCKGCYELNHAP